MKVIAKSSSEVYICEVHHSEIEKFLGLYYGKMNKVEVGEEINLARSYDYDSKIIDAVKKMEQLINSAMEVTEALKYAKLIKKRIELVKEN